MTASLYLIWNSSEVYWKSKLIKLLVYLGLLGWLTNNCLCWFIDRSVSIAFITNNPSSCNIWFHDSFQKLLCPSRWQLSAVRFSMEITYWNLRNREAGWKKQAETNNFLSGKRQVHNIHPIPFSIFNSIEIVIPFRNKLFGGLLRIIYISCIFCRNWKRSYPHSYQNLYPSI